MTKRKHQNGPRPLENATFAGSASPENVRDGERTETSTNSESATASPRASQTAAASPDRERIASRAYELYLERGGDHGRDQEDWLRAEREISRPDRGDRGE